MYPPDSRKGKSRGKLRYLCEASPLAFVAENAGGAATDGHNRILDITPTTRPARMLKRSTLFTRSKSAHGRMRSGGVIDGRSTSGRVHMPRAGRSFVYQGYRFLY